MKTRSKCCRSQRSHRRGLTLLDTVIAIGSSGILLVGLASTLLVASRTATAPLVSQELTESSLVCTRVLEDIRHATRILSHASDHIEVLRSDCDGDGLPDVVKLEYVAGTKRLKRNVDGGAWEVLRRQVGKFDVRLQEVAATEDVPISGVMQTGVLFSNSWNPAVATMPAMPPVFADVPKLIGQTFLAGDFLPGLDFTQWYRITKIHFYTQEKNPNPAMWMQLCQGAGSLQPTGDALTAQLPPSDAKSEGENTVRYSFRLADPICHLSKRDRLAIVLPNLSPVWINDSQPTLSLSNSTDGGATWNQEVGQLAFAVEGETRTVSTPRPISRSRFTAASIEIQTDDANGRAVFGSTEIDARPLNVQHRFQARFDRDPRLLDGDGDGNADWEATNFDASELAEGVWSAPAGSAVLKGVGSALSGELDVHLVCRVADSAASPSLVLGIPWNESAGKTAGVRVEVGKDAHNNQLIRLYAAESATDEPLIVVRDLPDRMIHVRLLFLADEQVVVWIDDQSYGSFPLTRGLWNEPYVSLKTVNSAVEIDLIDLIEY